MPLETGLFIDPEREILREGVEYWSYPPPGWWMEKAGEALALHSDLMLNIRVPDYIDETWDATAYVQTLIREWELYRVHFPVPARLSVLWMSPGFALLSSPLRWKELLETLRRSLSNWSVAIKVLEVIPQQTTEEQLFRLHEFGFRHLRVNLMCDEPVMTALPLIREARKMGYSSVRALCSLGHLAPGELDKLPHLRPDVVEWPDWLTGSSSSREAVRKAFLPLGYDEIAPGCFALSHDPLYKASETGDLSFGILGYMPRYSRLAVGLGAGAWSDAWSGMVQNEVVPETYAQKVRQGGLAPANGILWSENAQKMRLHRHNLRCLGEIQWGEPGFKCPELQAALERMKPLEKEGLLEFFSDKGLVLTDKGRKQWERILSVF